MKKMLIGLSTLALAGIALIGAPQAAEAQPLPAVTPLKVTVVLSRYSGERKLSSAPYTMSVTATAGRRDAPVSVRMGVQVPVSTMTKDGASYNYRNVGTNIDCWAMPIEGNRFSMSMSVEQSSLYDDDKTKRPATVASEPPVFRSFTTSFTVILKDGETTQFISATDPVSGEVLKIDVTLNVVK